MQSSPETITGSSIRIPSNSSITPSGGNSSRALLAIIAGVTLLFMGAYFYIQFQNKKETMSKQKIVSIKPSQIPKTTISEWETYTNTTFGYSINYPSDWIAREFPSSKSGAAFRPANMSDETQYEYISINKNEKMMLDDLSSLSFEEYVKRAGMEIQNYNTLASIKKIVTDSGIVGYTTTWNITSLGSGKKSESSPRTYFEIPQNDTATIQVEITDEKYINIYNQMISSFTMLEKKENISNINLKLYNSPKIGIKFTYLEKQNSQEITIKENDNKICVSYDTNDIDCSMGQSVEVFQKGADEKLEVAIKRLFLAEKDPNICLITVSDPNNYPQTFIKAEITFPKTEEFDMEKMAANTEYCSRNYAQTNGIRYFLEDKAHPTKFLFFSIGQYAILSDENKTWQETVSFE